MTTPGATPAAPRRSRRLVAAAAVNGALVVAEIIAGLAARSSALLSDAGHNLADVGAIVLSLAALRWALRPRSEQRTYGNHRGTILAALANATFLALVTCAVVALAVYRLLHPAAVHGPLMSEVAGAALVVNAAAALTLRDPGRDLNLRSAALHMAADAAASAGVVVAGIVVALVGRRADLADPAAALAVSLLILAQAVRVVRQSADVLLESTPSDVDLSELRKALTSVDGVAEVHDLHVWSLSSDYRALSAHLVLTGHPTLEAAQAVGAAVRRHVSPQFDIAHTTFEMECERCDDQLADPCSVDDALHAPGRGETPSNRPA
ncbi:MAG: cation diffusion facilitator family transporter [Actinomycetota bacterium]|nr:cation diffusion facilitator family transporter [Actinomycetota bacterium]MDA8358053.1 cation diffusion facilitator family transporter [Actinomycetota bacterium]